MGILTAAGVRAGCASALVERIVDPIFEMRKLLLDLSTRTKGLLFIITYEQRLRTDRNSGKDVAILITSQQAALAAERANVAKVEFKVAKLNEHETTLIHDTLRAALPDKRLAAMHEELAAELKRLKALQFNRKSLEGTWRQQKPLNNRRSS